MDRSLEPELMLDPAQAGAYAHADFSAPNQAFCDFLLARLSNLPNDCHSVDLGCGPADIVRRLATARPEWHFTAIDGSEAMLAPARAALREANLLQRVQLVCSHLPELPSTVKQHSYDLVISNSLLHHLPDPSVLWRTVRRLAKPGAAVLVGDLLRPQSPAAAQAIVDTYATGEPDILRRDFLQSLCAAFTAEEIIAQLETAGLSGLRFEPVSDRHGYVFGTLLD
jgi:ubiquinone/menaquinone biosynthesis C-methylase UbiE